MISRELWSLVHAFEFLLPPFAKLWPKKNNLNQISFASHYIIDNASELFIQIFATSFTVPLCYETCASIKNTEAKSRELSSLPMNAKTSPYRIADFDL